MYLKDESRTSRCRTYFCKWSKTNQTWRNLLQNQGSKIIRAWYEHEYSWKLRTLKTVRPEFHLLKYGTLVNEVQEASKRCNIWSTQVVTAKSIVFWDVALYSLSGRYRYFMKTCTSVSLANDREISDSFYQSVHRVTSQKTVALSATEKNYNVHFSYCFHLQKF